jgi:hypothetical protein
MVHLNICMTRLSCQDDARCVCRHKLHFQACQRPTSCWTARSKQDLHLASKNTSCRLHFLTMQYLFDEHLLHA